MLELTEKLKKRNHNSMRLSLTLSIPIIGWNREFYFGVGKGNFEIIGASIIVLALHIELSLKVG